MKLNLLQWLLQGIPECLAVVCLATVLARRKPEIGKIALMGVIDAVIIYFIRLLPLTFGVHTILQIFIVASLLYFFIKTPSGKSLFSALLVIVILTVYETVFFTLLLSLASISLEQLTKDILLYIISGWPQVILLFILALAINENSENPLINGIFALVKLFEQFIQLS